MKEMINFLINIHSHYIPCLAAELVVTFGVQ